MADVPLMSIVPGGGDAFAANRGAAMKALKLSPQEQNLYDHHLNNLLGSGKVVNPDGSISTIYQGVQEHDGKFYNIPTVWNGQRLTEPWTNPNTKQMMDVPNAQALQNVDKAGWDTFPSYPTPDAADARYEQMHSYMDRDVGAYKALQAPQTAPPIGGMAVPRPASQVPLGSLPQGMIPVF